LPLIQVHLGAGRTPEQKRALLGTLTEAAHSSLGTPIESIRVWIVEVAPEEYMAGGELLADKRARTAAAPDPA
jgi:4-oxalocrotonate tautomerase